MLHKKHKWPTQSDKASGLERGRDKEVAYKIQILVTKSVLLVIVFIDSSFLVSAVNKHSSLASVLSV